MSPLSKICIVNIFFLTVPFFILGNKSLIFYEILFISFLNLCQFIPVNSLRDRKSLMQVFKMVDPGPLQGLIPRIHLEYVFI